MTPAPKPELALYRIKRELLELLDFREDILSDPDITAQEQQSSLDAIHSQIKTYIANEVAEVDGIASMMRECETREAINKAEADRVKEVAASWRKRHELLETLVIETMQFMHQVKLEGPTSKFQIKKNPPSVYVVQPELVPANYQRRTVTIPEDLWQGLLTTLGKNSSYSMMALELLGCKSTDPEAVKSVIAEDLKCSACGGRSKDREKCQLCGGSGLSKDGVPGARLTLDSVRLEVK